MNYAMMGGGGVPVHREAPRRGHGALLRGGEVLRPDDGEVHHRGLGCRFVVRPPKPEPLHVRQGQPDEGRGHERARVVEPGGRFDDSCF